MRHASKQKNPTRESTTYLVHKQSSQGYRNQDHIQQVRVLRTLWFLQRNVQNTSINTIQNYPMARTNDSLVLLFELGGESSFLLLRMDESDMIASDSGGRQHPRRGLLPRTLEVVGRRRGFPSWR